MILVLILALILPQVAVASVSWALQWIWTPLCLVQSCRRQGIPTFPASHLAKKDLAWTWKLLNSVNQHGKIFYCKFGKFVRLVVLDPVLIQQILIRNADCYEKPSFVTILEILGTGIFTASGEEWKHQRQLLGQSFLLKELKPHFDAIKRHTMDEMESWDACLHLKNQEIDIHERFLGLTVKMIGHIAFGEQIEPHTAADIFKGFDRYLHNYKSLLCSPCFSAPGYRCLQHQTSQEIGDDIQNLLSLIKEFVRKRKSRFKSSHEETKKQLVLDLMLSECKHGNVFSQKMILDNCATFLLAGHETTASLLTWTVYLLAVHPLWQERARAEVAEILEVKELDWTHLSQLKTVNMIFWESLRLFPPQPIIGRSCVQENTVENILIPKKLEVVIPVSALHRDKDVWGEDSEEFMPARFANGINQACKFPAAFLPFGSGPRTCIGQSLALLEARIILSLMLHKYSWKLSPGYQHCPDITLTLQPRFGMPIILVKL